MLLGLGGFLAVSVGIVANADDPDMQEKQLLAGWLGVLLIPPVLAWLPAMLATSRGVVLELTPAGLRDRRASDEVIAWTDVVQVIPTGRGRDIAVALQLKGRLAAGLAPSKLSRF